MSFRRLLRFVPRSNDKAILLGEPADADIDVGVAVRKGEEVSVNVYSGTSALNPGVATGRVEQVARILSPLTEKEVGTIRCIGLNYRSHAEEVNMAIPNVPTLFLKPATALADPWPVPTVIPKHTAPSDSADYESELAIVLGRTAKNVSEADAMAHVLGFTACNDVSARAEQLAQTQWCYSKGFDGSAPLGPCLVSPGAMGEIGKARIRGLKNGKVAQDAGLDDMIFSVPKLVSFCSQGTTLPAGTVIITGTPAGVGNSQKPQNFLHDGDEFVVEILPHIGSLYSVMRNDE